jgi:hypothetical protein
VKPRVASVFDAKASGANVVQLHLRGVNFEQIGQQLGIDRTTSFSLAAALVGAAHEEHPRPRHRDVSKTPA